VWTEFLANMNLSKYAQGAFDKKNLKLKYTPKKSNAKNKNKC
jgi:hypothetical protein